MIHKILELKLTIDGEIVKPGTHLFASYQVVQQVSYRLHHCIENVPQVITVLNLLQSCRESFATPRIYTSKTNYTGIVDCLRRQP